MQVTTSEWRTLFPRKAFGTPVRRDVLSRACKRAKGKIGAGRLEEIRATLLAQQQDRQDAVDQKTKRDDRGANAGASTGESSAVTVRTAVTPLEKRADALADVGSKALGLFHQCDWPGGDEWNEAVATLKEAGIEPDLRVNDYDANAKGVPDYIQRVEWYLGQLLKVAEAENDSHLRQIISMAGDIKTMPFGHDLAGQLQRRDDRNERVLESFKRTQQRTDRIEYDSREMNDLFGDYRGGSDALTGRKTWLVHRNEKGENVERRGTWQPHPEEMGWFILESGDQQHEIRKFDVKAQYFEDTSPVTPAEFEKAQKAKGAITLGSHEGRKLFGGPYHFSGRDFEGHHAAVIITNKERQQYEVVEGKIGPPADEHASATFYIFSDLGPVKLHISDVESGLWLEDTSKVTPNDFARMVKKNGDIKFESEEGRALFGSMHDFDDHKFGGREIRLLRPNKETRRYELIEGTIVPNVHRNAWLDVQTKKGIVKLNISDVYQDLYLADTSPVSRAEFLKRAKKEKWEPADFYKFNGAELDGRPAYILRVNKETLQYEVVEGKIRPHPRDGALFNLETANGVQEWNLNNVQKALWLGPPT